MGTLMPNKAIAIVETNRRNQSTEIAWRIQLYSPGDWII